MEFVNGKEETDQRNEAIEPHDDIINRLKKDLERREEKLRKKPTRWNLLQRNRVRHLLKDWESDREKCLTIKEKP